jgi:hypothetical protein
VLELPVLDRAGENRPEILHTLPPGRYLIEPFGQREELTPEAEAGLLEAIEDLDSGNGVPLDECRREFRERYLD